MILIGVVCDELEQSRCDERAKFCCPLQKQHATLNTAAHNWLLMQLQEAEMT